MCILSMCIGMESSFAPKLEGHRYHPLLYWLL
jgi:hypothetical protein